LSLEFEFDDEGPERLGVHFAIALLIVLSKIIRFCDSATLPAQDKQINGTFVLVAPEPKFYAIAIKVGINAVADPESRS
jgi:hypothetical protein